MLLKKKKKKIKKTTAVISQLFSDLLNLSIAKIDFAKFTMHDPTKKIQSTKISVF